MRLRYIPIIIATLLCALSFSACNAKAVQNTNNGIEYYNNGKFEEAEKYFLEAVKEGADDSDDYVNLGMTYIALGDYDQATAYFNRALEADEKSQTAHKGLAIVYLNSGNYDKSIEEIGLVLEYADGTVTDFEKDTLNYRAEAEYKAGKYDDAIKTYGILIEVGYNVKEQYYQRANVYLLKGNIEKAMDDFNSVISYDKKDYDTYYDIYTVLKTYGYEEQSIEIIKQTLSISEDNATGYYDKGKTYYILNETDKCITELTQARAAGSIDALYLLGVVYMENGEYAKAEAAFEEYNANEKTSNAESYNALGRCYYMEGNYDMAVNCFEDGLLIDADNEDLMVNLAVAYEYKQDYAMAIVKFNAVLEKYPDNETARHELEFLSR